MKKLFFLLIAILASECYAVADNITVKDVTLINYEASTVEVNLTCTSSDIVALQFNMILPDGIEPVMEGNDVVINASDRLAGNYILHASQVGDGSYLFVFLSKDRTPITPESSTLFTFGIKKVQKNDGNYTAAVSNVIMSDIKGEKTTLENSSFAVTVISKYDIIYMIDDEEYKRVSYFVGSPVEPEPEPMKVGYTFSGWTDIPDVMPAHDVTVVANWIINSYKLIYKVDGEVYKELEVEYGASIIPEEEPQREGYTFSGWTDIPSTMPAKDVVVEASWKVNTYKLIYMIDGEVYKELEVEYNSIVIPEENPFKDGYKFSGWSEIPQIMPAEDVVVIGSFEKIAVVIDIQEEIVITTQEGDENVTDEEIAAVTEVLNNKAVELTEDELNLADALETADDSTVTFSLVISLAGAEVSNNEEGDIIVSGMSFEVKLNKVEDGITENVDNSAIKKNITFRLPVQKEVEKPSVRLKHNNEDIGLLVILIDEDTEDKYVEVATGSFSTFSYLISDLDISQLKETIAKARDYLDSLIDSKFYDCATILEQAVSDAEQALKSTNQESIDVAVQNLENILEIVRKQVDSIITDVDDTFHSSMKQSNVKYLRDGRIYIVTPTASYSLFGISD